MVGRRSFKTDFLSPVINERIFYRMKIITESLIGKFRFYIIVACLSAMFFGCHDSNTGSPVINPFIKGYVVLYSDGVNQLTDSSGVRIMLDGPVRDSVITTRGGSWSFNSLRPGSYTIVFSKPDFGPNKIFNLRVSGGKGLNLGKIILVKKPGFDISSFSINQTGSGVQFSGNIAVTTGSTFGTTIAFFMDTTDLIYTNPSHYLGYVTTFVQNPSVLYSFYLSNSDLQSMLTLLSGTHVYVTATTASALFVFSGYPDSTTGGWVYTAVGDSTKDSSFTMP